MTLLLISLLLSQMPPAQTPPAEPADKAADAAVKAADAAEKAAEAAQKTADAASTLIKAQCPPVPTSVTATATPPAPAKLPPDTTPWTSTVGLGLIWLTGNSNTLTFNGNATASKTWAGWGIGIKAFGTYGETALNQGPETVTALQAGVRLRGSRDVTPSVPIFIAVGVETDHIKSEESLTFAEVGAGIIWAQRKEADYEKLLLRTDLSMHYEYETDFQYYPTTESLPHRDLLGPRVGLIFRYAMRKDVIFTEDADVIPNVLGAARVRVDSMTKVASRLTGSLSLTMTFQVNYDSVPPPGKLPTDTALMAGLELAL
jgi:hypothetical protein